MSSSTALPDIPIPRSRYYDSNERRFGVTSDRCLICACPVEHHKKIVLLSADLGEITAPTDDQESTGGCFYVGPDCWRRHPELHAYEWK